MNHGHMHCNTVQYEEVRWKRQENRMYLTEHLCDHMSTKIANGHREAIARACGELHEVTGLYCDHCGFAPHACDECSLSE